jgi:hypothetical protein
MWISGEASDEEEADVQPSPFGKGGKRRWNEVCSMVMNRKRDTVEEIS